MLRRSDEAVASCRELEALTRVVDGGLCCPDTFERDPWLAPLRGDSAFAELLARARAGHEAGRAIYPEAGGEKRLGAAVEA